ncbi:MAG: phage holin family protein [Bacteroidota bacterium]
MDNVKDYIFKFLRLENLVSSLTGYVETKVALVKMEIREEVAHVVSKGIVMLVLSLFGFLFLLFASIGIAKYLNTFFEGDYAGFLIVGGFFGLLLLIIVLFKNTFLHAFEKQIKENFRKKES